MADVMALVHELRGGELYGRPRSGRETGGNFREAADELGRRNHEAESHGRADCLAEGADVDDAPVAIERCERGCGPPRELQLA